MLQHHTGHGLLALLYLYLFSCSASVLAVPSPTSEDGPDGRQPRSRASGCPLARSFMGNRM